jgi:cytidylate kinase
MIDRDRCGGGRVAEMLEPTVDALILDTSRLDATLAFGDAMVLIRSRPAVAGR